MTGGRFPVARLIVLVVFLLAVTLIGLLVPLPTVAALRHAVTGAGLFGGTLFVLGYAVVTLSPMPKSVLSIVAGLVWGFAIGALTVYLGALLGAAAAFVLGRQLGRDAVERLTGARVETVARALESRGFLAVLIARLIPVVPFTAINYAAGLTRIRRRDYALATALGIIPGDLAYVAVGAYGLQLGWGLWVAVGALALLTGAGAVLGRRVRRRFVSDEGDTPDV